MSIVVVCQFCRKRYRFRDTDAGQSTTCEQCGDVMTVPFPESVDVRTVTMRKPSSNGDSPGGRAGPPRPVDPFSAEVPRDPSRPAVSDSVNKVGIGVSLVMWDVTLSALIYLALTMAPVFLQRQIPLVPMFRLLAGLQLLWIGVVVFGIIGRALCLVVPGESQAKPYIFMSVLLQLYFVLIIVASVSLRGDLSGYVMLSGEVAQLLAHVLFLGFLRRLSQYLRREDLYRETQRSMTHGALFVVAALMAIMSKIFFLPVIGNLFFLANCIISPMLFFPYVRLLNSFRLAVKAIV